MPGSLLDDSSSFIYSAALRASAADRIADHLLNGPTAVAQLSRASRTDAHSVRHLAESVAPC